MKDNNANHSYWKDDGASYTFLVSVWKNLDPQVKGSGFRTYICQKCNQKTAPYEKFNELLRQCFAGQAFHNDKKVLDDEQGDLDKSLGELCCSSCGKAYGEESP